MMPKTTAIQSATQSILLAFGCLMCWSGPARAVDAPTGIVGEVIAAIGEGRILSGAGQAQTTARGVHVRAGDSVETAVGGHVHIRFVDGALVSVRPLSRLSIEEYRNADDRGLAAIKFRLEDGVMRSVTGRWGEANRERFRLNTPIAAIGIKGTDFVVRAASDNTYAGVLSGAIVMAPLEGSCAQALGPCQGDKAIELNADMAGLMLEMQRGNGSAAPRLVPSVDLLASATRTTTLAQRRNEVTEVAGIVEKLPIADAGAAGNAADSIATPQTSKPLLWLHNALGWNVPANSISQRYDEALVAGRSVAVSNLFITLYRDETVMNTFQPEGTAATFTLKGASASYTPATRGGQAENVAVSGATLNVDFSRSSYATHLNLSGQTLGQTSFDASGAIARNGVFVDRQTGQSLTGAFGMNGREAGYMFDKSVTGGNVSGLTLWGR